MLYKTSIMGSILLCSLLLWGCEYRIIEPEPDNQLSGVWNSYIHNSDYEYKSILVHIVQEKNKIDGLGDFEGIPLEITSGNVVNNIVAFNFILYDTNFGDVKGTFRGNLVNNEIHGHWQINVEFKTYSIYFKRNDEIIWLP